MTTVYYAIDGTEFKDKRECLEHEKEIRDKFAQDGKDYLYMYNRNGEGVEDPDEAYLIYIQSSAMHYDDMEKGACYFINLSNNQGSPYDGINDESAGWYYWNENIDSYCWMDEDLVEAIYKTVKNRGGSV